MDTLDIVALQQQLSERIAALDAQRKAESERYEKELADRNALAEVERQERIASYKEAEAKRLEKQRLAEEAIKAQQSEAMKKQVALEQALANAQAHEAATKKAYQDLQEACSKQEFIEEQHAKQMQSKSVAIASETSATEINVEHPEAPLNKENPGEAVVGTEGSTPSTPLLSQHMRMVLRQFNRTD